MRDEARTSDLPRSPEIDGRPCPRVQVKRYFRFQELRQVKTLQAAINLARVNTITRGCYSATNAGNPIYEAFR